MKKNWLFNVYWGLYYPIIWGLFHKPLRQDLYESTRIQWKVLVKGQWGVALTVYPRYLAGVL